MVLALGACGGGNDEEDAENAVKEIAKASSAADGEKFCGLLTEDFREKFAGSSGDNADGGCEKLVDSQKGNELKVTRIMKVELDGDKATVTAELERRGRKLPQVFELKKEGGEYRLTGESR